MSGSGTCYPALAQKSHLLLAGGVNWTRTSPKLRLGGQASAMNGFQTPDSKRSQALKSDSGLDGSGDDGWDFLVGTAISVYQNSGGDNNNWWRYERQRTRLGRPTIDVSAHFRLLLPDNLLTATVRLTRRVRWRHISTSVVVPSEFWCKCSLSPFGS